MEQWSICTCSFSSCTAICELVVPLHILPITLNPRRRVDTSHSQLRRPRTLRPSARCPHQPCHGPTVRACSATNGHEDSFSAATHSTTTGPAHHRRPLALTAPPTIASSHPPLFSHPRRVGAPATSTLFLVVAVALGLWSASERCLSSWAS